MDCFPIYHERPLRYQLKIACPQQAGFTTFHSVRNDVLIIAYNLSVFGWIISRLVDDMILSCFMRLAVRKCLSQYSHCHIHVVTIENGFLPQ